MSVIPGIMSGYVARRLYADPGEQTYGAGTFSITVPDYWTHFTVELGGGGGAGGNGQSDAHYYNGGPGGDSSFNGTTAGGGKGGGGAGGSSGGAGGAGGIALFGDEHINGDPGAHGAAVLGGAGGSTNHVLGGAGGTGGREASGGSIGAGGGGAGAYCRRRWARGELIPGETYQLVVGRGGTVNAYGATKGTRGTDGQARISWS